ncbi:MAG: sigma-70 family RNA polymerase sigma factor [Acidobacteria bacterium]|nr:sigma-70 family RNA polymerase sigma factor [Acidobacteriota bacterium]
MPTDVTLLLDELNQNRGDRETLDQLMPLVYGELRRLAASFLRREHAVSIQTTELVHEAYFKLTKQRSVDWNNKGQFFAIAAQAMRRILIDAARSRKSKRRDGIRLSLDEAPTVSYENEAGLLELNDALERLAEFDPRQAKIVELRYFGGLSIDEIAAVLEVSPATVRRDWTIAKAWLYSRLSTK